MRRGSSCARWGLIRMGSERMPATMKISVKRKIASLIAAAVVLLGLAYVFTPDGSVGQAAFELRFSAVVGDAGFRKLADVLCSTDEVPLPLRIRWDPRHWRNGSAPIPVTGFPDSAAHYVFSTNGSPPLDCFVGYLNSRVTLIAIRAPTVQEAAARALRALCARFARALRAALEREFPWLAITLTIRDGFS